MQRPLLALGLAALLCLCATPTPAQEGRRRRRERAEAAAAAASTPHGGRTASTDELTVEVVVSEDAVRVWVTDRAGQPASLRGVSGKADLLLVRPQDNRPRRAVHQSTTVRLSAVPASPRQGRLRDHLAGSLSLGHEDLQGMRMDLTLHFPGAAPVEIRIEGLAACREVVWTCACGRRFADPGECPDCKQPLARAAAPEAPDGDEGDGDEGDPDEAEGGRRRR